MASPGRDIFINCPFDDDFAPGFRAGLPVIAEDAGLNVASLLYADFERLVLAWVKADIAAGRTAAARRGAPATK